MSGVINHNLQDSSYSYQEDFELENGQYMNKCCICGEMFIGHKRRVICKMCHNAKPLQITEEHKRDYTALIEAGTAAVMEKLLENGNKPGFDNLDLYEEFENLQDECTELFLQLFKMNGERISEELRDYRKGRREAADVIALAMMMVKAFDDKIRESGI